MMICDECQALYEEVGDRVRNASVFAKVRRTDERLRCLAKNCESPAEYRAEVNLPEHDVIYVGLYTPDRWLSESIEADVMHVGDKFEELLEEELVDQGWDTSLEIEHYRNDAKEFVFRSVIRVGDDKIDGEPMIDRISKALLAYEACFRELGDMSAGDEEG